MRRDPQDWGWGRQECPIWELPFIFHLPKVLNTVLSPRGQRASPAIYLMPACLCQWWLRTAGMVCSCSWMQWGLWRYIQIVGQLQHSFWFILCISHIPCKVAGRKDWLKDMLRLKKGLLSQKTQSLFEKTHVPQQLTASRALTRGLFDSEE